MSADLTLDARRAAYVAALRAIADHMEAGLFPVDGASSFSWHVDRATAKSIATALGGKWTPSEDSRDGTAVVQAALIAGRFPFSPLLTATLFVAPDAAPPEPRRTASTLLAAEIRVAVEQRERIAVELSPPITREQLAAVAPELLRDDLTPGTETPWDPQRPVYNAEGFLVGHHRRAAIAPELLRDDPTPGMETPPWCNFPGCPEPDEHRIETGRCLVVRASEGEQ